MKNNNIKNKCGAFIVIAMYVLLGCLCGFLIMRHIDAISSEQSMYKYELFIFALMFIWLYVSIFISTVLHEAGHLLFGLFTGYKFLSFRVGGIMLIKTDGKMKLKKFKMPGTGGQCIMAPPEVIYDDFPSMLFNFGGVVINIFAALVSIVVYAFTSSILAGGFCLIFALVNAFSGLINGLPMTVGIYNDGKNALRVRRDDAARRAFFMQLNVARLQTEGVRLKDMPNEWFESSEQNDYSDALKTWINMAYCQRLTDLKEFETATLEIERIIANPDILDMYKNILLCDLIYCKLVTNADRNEIAALLTPKLKKFMKMMSDTIGILRTEFAIALLYYKDEKYANKILKKFQKVLKKYPYKADIESESELIETAKSLSE